MANINDRNDLGTTSGGARGGLGDWNSEENYWRTAWSSRPYATADRSFDQYRPGFRYGYESANRMKGKSWSDAENDLRSGWDRYEHRGDSNSTWEQIKDSVRDAWDRVTGGDKHDSSRRSSTL